MEYENLKKLRKKHKWSLDYTVEVAMKVAWDLGLVCSKTVLREALETEADRIAASEEQLELGGL